LSGKACIVYINGKKCKVQKKTDSSKLYGNLIEKKEKEYIRKPAGKIICKSTNKSVSETKAQIDRQESKKCLLEGRADYVDLLLGKKQPVKPSVLL
jgi:hypothetical protein